MSDSLAEKFNRQIDLELASSIAYLQMAAYFDSRSLQGMAQWMRVQSEEERAHALKFFDHVLHRGNTISLGGGEAPKTDFESVLDAFETAFAQEQRVSQAISGLYAAALADGDSASFALLQWFLEEQIEEESIVSDIVEQLKMIGDDGGALLLLDRELGQRQAA
ncbi:MAG: ferritin [Acidimicrobiia bacterium]